VVAVGGMPQFLMCDDVSVAGAGFVNRYAWSALDSSSESAVSAGVSLSGRTAPKSPWLLTTEFSLVDDGVMSAADRVISLNESGWPDSLRLDHRHKAQPTGALRGSLRA
jgi:hypothetical protein